MTALRVFAIDMETEIADFFARAPFQQHSAAGASLRLEGRKLHRGRRLNRRNRGRDIVVEFGSLVEEPTRGRIGHQRGRTERRPPSC